MTVATETPWNFAFPHEEREAADRFFEEWHSSLKPHDNFEVYLLRQVAVNAVRIDRCQHQERAIRALHATRAGLCWDEDRRKAAEVLGARLRGSPTVVLHKLAATRQGCDWLIVRWEGLGRVLDANGEWDADQEALALDLLGLANEFREGPTPLDADLEGRRRLVRDEVDRLHALNARAMEELDGREREMAILGFGPDLDGQLAAVRRFERLCSRHLEWARNQLRSYRKGPNPDGSGPGSSRSGSYQIPSPAPPPARKTEEEWREATRALAASRTAAPSPEPAPVPEPTIVEESDEERVARMSPEERREAIRNHPEYQALSPLNRIMTLLTGEVAQPTNRRARRAQKARARRRG